jgi:hypothetical protein
MEASQGRQEDTAHSCSTCEVKYEIFGHEVLLDDAWPEGVILLNPRTFQDIYERATDNKTTAVEREAAGE